MIRKRGSINKQLNCLEMQKDLMLHLVHLKPTKTNLLWKSWWWTNANQNYLLYRAGKIFTTRINPIFHRQESAFPSATSTHGIWRFCYTILLIGLGRAFDTTLLLDRAAQTMLPILFHQTTKSTLLIAIRLVTPQEEITLLFKLKELHKGWGIVN